MLVAKSILRKGGLLLRAEMVPSSMIECVSSILEMKMTFQCDLGHAPHSSL